MTRRPPIPRAALQLASAAREVREMWLELRQVDLKLAAFADKVERGHPLSPEIAMVLRANADRVSDRAVVLHDLARQLEAMLAPDGDHA